MQSPRSWRALRYGAYRVVPNRDLRALWSNVQRGKLPGVALVCGATPPPSLLAEVVYAGAMHASTEVRCETSSCRLEVVVSRPARRDKGEHEDKEVASFVASLPASEDPIRWAGRVRAEGLRSQVRPVNEMGGLGGMLMPGTKPGVYAVLDSVTQSGTWTYELETSLFQPFAQALDACGADHRAWRPAPERVHALTGYPAVSDERPTRVGGLGQPSPDHLQEAWSARLNPRA